MLEMLLAKRYKILRVLGTGGFGQTYVAEDVQQPNSPVCVVKHLQPASQDQQFLEIARRLFQTEAKTLQRLGQHPQIPSLLDSFEEAGEFYLVQEFIDGYPFNEEISGGFQLGEPQVVALLKDVLQILEFVHNHHVIHRDIKPGNLIRRQDGKVVLIDFGAVKEIRTQLMSGSVETGQTGFTVGIGTQGYTPSEQLAGKPRYCSDIYALGMTALQALTGLQPSQLPENPVTAEVNWRDFAPVSEGLALLLNKMVRQHFMHRYQSVAEVLRDLDRLDELPHDMSFQDVLPATQLPEPETWQQRVQRGWKVVAIASIAVTGLCLGLRSLGSFQPLELAAYDALMRLRPSLGVDPRLLVVEITEEDLRQLQRSTPSDQTIATAIAQLQQYQPRVIGVDLYREVPQAPGQEALKTQFDAENVIVITEIGPGSNLRIPPPAGVPAERVGFNDLVVDADQVVRRNLMFASLQDETLYSFALRVALEYLASEGILPRNSQANPNNLQLGETIFQPLEATSGGYARLDAQGYQALLDYRAPDQAARRVTLSEVLAGQFEPDWVRDKAVLIGTTASSSKDLFYTPFSPGQEADFQMPGVIVHAQMVSQFLSAAIEGQPLFWFWPEWAEILWIGGWAIAGGSFAWFVRRPLILIVGGVGLLVIIGGTTAILFFQHGWIPGVAPATACLVAGLLVVIYRTYQAQRQPTLLTTMTHPMQPKNSRR